MIFVRGRFVSSRGGASVVLVTIEAEGVVDEGEHREEGVVHPERAGPLAAFAVGPGIAAFGFGGAGA
jgi:hypothetical protein